VLGKQTLVLRAFTQRDLVYICMIVAFPGDTSESKKIKLLHFTGRLSISCLYCNIRLGLFPIELMLDARDRTRGSGRRTGIKRLALRSTT